MMCLPTSSDVVDAGCRLSSYLSPTPLLNSERLDRRLGCRLFFKAETLQPTGSFKVRGAYNRLLSLSPKKRRAGIVAWSAGNHGMALAYVGQKLAINSVIVTPRDAPKVKVERMRDMGAEVILYDRHSQSRESLGCEIAEDRNLTLVPPFDDPRVIAGQGTIALEVAAQLDEMGISPDVFVACVGGGGMIAGCALGFEALGVDVQIVSAEPQHYDDTRRSIASGKLVKNNLSIPCISDALMTEQPSELTVALNKSRISVGTTISENAIKEAVRLCYEELRLVVEPGGAAALASVLENPEIYIERNVVVTLSGGNVDAALFADILTGAVHAQKCTD